MITNHNQYLDIAFQIAEKNLGKTNQNPSVGCVVVKNGTVISSGVTSKNGRPHSEFNALSKLKNCNLIIEFHRHPIDEENKKFREKLNKYFKVSLLSTSNRSFSDISLLKELNDDDRWLIASENRPYLMNWFVCTPK